MSLELQVDWEGIQKKIDDLNNTKPRSDQSEIIVHYQGEMEKQRIIFEEIRKVISSFNMFKKYTVKDYDHAVRLIHELLEMIGK